MSAPLHSLIADELGVSEDRARKLLYAMLREVRKRASRGKGVHLPDLGTFTEENGDLTFTPSDTLARSVNKRFAGLGSEAVSVPDEGEAQEEQTAGISTGFQSRPSGSSGDADTDEFEAPDTDEIEAPDTDEFSAPDTDELEAPDTDEFSAPDTDELQTPDTEEIDASSSSSAPAEEKDSRTRRSGTGPIEIPDVSSYSSSEDTSSGESAPPSTEDTPEPSPASSPEDPPASGRSLYDPPPKSPSASKDEPEPAASEDNDDTGSSIWDDDSAWDFSTASYDEDSEDVVDDEPETVLPEAVPPEPVPESSDEADEPAVPLREESRPPQESRGDRASVTAQSTSNGGSGVGKALVALLVALMVVGGAWFVLGQQGYVPTPGSIFSNANVTQPVTDRGAGESSSEAASTADASSASGSTTSETSPTNDASEAESSSPTTESTQSTQTESQTGAQAPIRDGWTIVVASRTTERAAQELVSTYRSRFASDNLPVDVVAGQTDAGTRYRVAVGRFTSGDAARSAINRYQDRLPQGAWPLEVQ